MHKAMLRTSGFMAAVMLIVIAAGCQQLNRPLSIEDGIAAVYTTVEITNTSTASRVASGLLSPAQARAIVAVTKEARLLADAASAALEVGNPAEAHSALALAISLLTVLEKRVSE